LSHFSRNRETLELPKDIDPEDRKKIPRDLTAVRRYGADYIERLESSGSRVMTDAFGKSFPPDGREEIRW